MIRIGVLGAGGNHSTRHHGPALERLAAERPGRVELAAVCDLDETRAKEYAGRFGFARTYTSLDAMLAAEELDGLVMVTPHVKTAEIVAPVMSRGIPLLIEKPPGLEPEDTERLAALAARHGTPHMVSFNRRFHHAATLAREWMAAHAAGRPILQAVARILRVGRVEERFLVDTGIHLVDATLSFMPRPVRVESRRYTTPNGGESADARVEFEGGATAALVFAPDAGVPEETCEFIGADWSAQVDTMKHALRIFDGGKPAAEWHGAPGDPVWISEGTSAEMERFVAAVEVAAPFWPTLTDSLASMRVAKAIRRGGTSNI